MANISLKALVDKTNIRVIFVESDEGFVDVLFSFLTMPMGTIVRLTRNQQPTGRLGCMNNLYESVENLETKHLRTEACKTMLLYPRNGAEDQCNKLRLKIDDSKPLEYFACERSGCLRAGYKLLSHYKNAICNCGTLMKIQRSLYEREPKRTALDAREGGVFVKGLKRLIVSDELQVMPSSTAASFRLHFILTQGSSSTSSLYLQSLNSNPCIMD